MRYTIGKKDDEKKVKLYTQKLAKNGVKIFRSSIDWMTLRIDEENCQFLQKLTYLVNNSPSIDLEFGGFLFYYVRDIASSACSIYELRDTVGNTLGSVLYVRNKAVGNKFTHLALGGTFWTFYPQFFEVFLDLFQIDKNSPHVLARVDYAVDIQGICVDDILRDYRKPSKGYGKG